MLLKIVALDLSNLVAMHGLPIPGFSPHTPLSNKPGQIGRKSILIGAKHTSTIIGILSDLLVSFRMMTKTSPMISWEWRISHQSIRPDTNHEQIGKAKRCHGARRYRPRPTRQEPFCQENAAEERRTEDIVEYQAIKLSLMDITSAPIRAEPNRSNFVKISSSFWNLCFSASLVSNYYWPNIP